ncbi:hypothetical protein GCM10010307_28230 [Streptomyces vastus]|uniref:Uncharacterized protein n=1 Tax=Streptomyces vastus TaxID=285451 RepID=A0ABN3QSP6_9ACTN
MLVSPWAITPIMTIAIRNTPKVIMAGMVRVIMGGFSLRYDGPGHMPNVCTGHFFGPERRSLGATVRIGEGTEATSGSISSGLWRLRTDTRMRRFFEGYGGDVDSGPEPPAQSAAQQFDADADQE